MRILIFDDDTSTVDMLLKTLPWKDMGITEFSPAYNVMQAKQVFRAVHIDLMICDIEAPGGTGLDLLRWVREQGYHTENVFLTNYAEFEFATEALRLGSIEYVLKMSKPEVIEAAVRKAAARARARIPDRDETTVTEPVLERSEAERIQSYIMNHFQEQLSRNDIAKEFYMSEDHLSHIFKRRFGISIPEYVNYLRIKNAAKMLAAGMNVSDAALDNGFENLSYFSTVFRKITGSSPSDYKKSPTQIPKL